MDYSDCVGATTYGVPDYNNTDGGAIYLYTFLNSGIFFRMEKKARRASKIGKEFQDSDVLGVAGNNIRYWY